MNNLNDENKEEIKESIGNLINSLNKSKKFEIETIVLGMKTYFENIDKMISKSYEKSLEYHKVLDKMESVLDIFIRLGEISRKATGLQNLDVKYDKDPFDIFS